MEAEANQDDSLESTAPEAPQVAPPKARASLDDIFAQPDSQTEKPKLDDIFAGAEKPSAANADSQSGAFDKVTETLAAPTNIISNAWAGMGNVFAKAIAGGSRAAGEYLPKDNLSPVGHEQTNFFTDVANNLDSLTGTVDKKLEKDLSPYKKTTTDKYATDVAVGVAQMPFYLASLVAAGPLGPASMMGLSSFEDTYDEAVKSGKTHDQAFNIAGGVGAIQGALNSVYIGRVLSIAEDSAKPIVNRVLTQTANAAIFNTVSSGSTTVALNQTGVRKQSAYDQIKDILYSVAVGTPAAVIGGAPFTKAHAPEAHDALEKLEVKDPDKVLESVPEIRETLKKAIVEKVRNDNIKAKNDPETTSKTLDTLQAMKEGNFDKVSDAIDERGGLTPKISTILERYKNRTPLPPEGVHYTDLKPDTEAFAAAEKVEAGYGYKLKPTPKPDTQIKIEEPAKESETEAVPEIKAEEPVSEHKAIVEKAINEGKDVPPEVLKEYPEAAAKVVEKNKAKDAELDSIITELEAGWAKEKEAPIAKVEEAPVQLPKELSGAKPRYNHGSKSFELAFDSGIDNALYVASGKGTSKKHDEFVKFLKDNGYNDAAIATEGQKIRDYIKATAKDAEPGTLNVKSQGVVERLSEVAAIEAKLGNPDTMTLPSLGRLNAKLEGIFADKAQTDKMSGGQFSVLEEYARRVEEAKSKLMRGSQTGAVDLSGLFSKITEKPKEPWEMTAEDYANIGEQKLFLDKVNPSKTFNPAGLSVDAKAMAGILREGKGEATRDTAQVVEKLNKYAKIVNALDPKEQLGLIDYMENRSNDMGVKIPDPALQVIADTYRDIYQSVEEAIKTQFPDAKMREDYFTHQYQDPKAAEKFFSDFIAKQGSGKNLRARAFPTLKEAMEFGLKPRTTNPSEIVGNYVTNMNNFLATHRTLQRMEQAGIAKFYEKGQQPAGWEPLKGNVAKEMDVLVASEGSEPFIKQGRELYAPANAARVYNNDISEGWKGSWAGIAETVQKASNLATKLSLLGPMHHFSTVTMGVMATDVARGAGLLAKGEVGEGLKAIGQGLTPGLSPAKNIALGRKVQEQYLGIDDHGPAYEKIVALGEAANVFHAQQQDYWKAGPAKDFIDDFKAQGLFQSRNPLQIAKDVGGATKVLGSELKGAAGKVKEKPINGTIEVIANGLSKTADSIAKPLFDVYVPLIKKGAFFSEMHQWLKENPLAGQEEQKAAARKIGDSMDNRFGEMMRDNLFWEKTTQQALQTTFLSYSWVVGGLRMLKGIPDTASGLIKGNKLTPNAKYLFGMAMTYAVYNAVATYLHTGKYADDDWSYRDLYSYRTGGKTVTGKAERAILPGHTTEYLHYAKEPLEEIGNKLSPGLRIFLDLASNKDFRGYPITDHPSWFDKEHWGDYAEHVMTNLEPIGEKTLRKGAKKGSKISTLERVLAVRPAPEFVTDPEGYERKEKARTDKAMRSKERSDERMESQYEE